MNVLLLLISSCKDDTNGDVPVGFVNKREEQMWFRASFPLARYTQMMICIRVLNHFRHKRLARFTLVFQMLGILFLVLLPLPLPFRHCAEGNRKGKEICKIELKVSVP